MVNDRLEMKISGKWHSVQTLDKHINPERFRVVWDESLPSFIALTGAAFNQTRQEILINGVQVTVWVEVSTYPHIEPDQVMYAIVKLTPVSCPKPPVAQDRSIGPERGNP